MNPSTPRADILGSFTGHIRPVKVKPTYQLALAAVTVAMVLLPLLYLGLIAATGWAVARYAVDGLSLFDTVSNAKSAFFLYSTPLFVGAVAIVFLIKPLFSRRLDDAPSHSLRPEEEPTLFAFVEKLCREVGAPTPTRIDVDCQVNASASFRRGALSLLSNDLVLTIGMPLARGLSLQQLAGVLAHEFGHFAQGAGMRLTYIVRSVNAWFARVVYERDSWDAKLDTAAKEASDVGLLIWVAVQAARGMVWLTRRILWALMHVGHAISCFLMRQMEFDADRYEARLVGAPTFAATARDLSLLGAGQQVAMNRLSETFPLGHLVDNVPELISVVRGRFEPDVVTEIDRRRLEERTGTFDTHPADVDRERSAGLETDPPAFRSELPATALFSDFEGLAQAVSHRFLEAQVGDVLAKTRLLPAKELLALTDQAEGDRETLERFTGGVFDADRQLPWPPAVEAEALARARDAMAAGLDRYRTALGDWQEIQRQLLRLDAAGEVLDAGHSFEPSAFEVDAATQDGIDDRRRELSDRAAPIEAVLEDHEGALITRLRAAVDALDAPDDGEARAERDRLLPALEAVNGGWMRLRAIDHCLSVLRFVLQQLTEDPAQPGDRVLDLVGELRRHLAELRSAWSCPCPFDFQSADGTLGEWAVPRDERSLDWPGLFELGEQTLGRGYETRKRLLTRLAALADIAETRVGYGPITEAESAGPAAAVAAA
ncbi:MAG: M48 family metallopeptidase [Acidobacteriota bacterium]